MCEPRQWKQQVNLFSVSNRADVRINLSGNQGWCLYSMCLYCTNVQPNNCTYFRIRSDQPIWVFVRGWKFVLGFTITHSVLPSEPSVTASLCSLSEDQQVCAPLTDKNIWTLTIICIFLLGLDLCGKRVICAHVLRWDWTDVCFCDVFSEGLNTS